MLRIIEQIRAAVEGRSSRWPDARRKHLQQHPACEVCGRRKDAEVHHLLPYHTHPEEELNPSNLWTLCRDHHLLFGHLMDWSSFNVSCVADSQTWRRKIQERTR